MNMTETEFRTALNYITSRTGIELPETNYRIVRKFLEKQTSEKRLNVQKYISFVETDKTEYFKFIDTVTINETYFFREEKHFKVLKKLLEKKAESEALVSLWSASCSSGEEPLSIFLTADEVLGEDRYIVHASDISEEMLIRFRSGRYRPNSFRADGSGFHGLIKNNSEKNGNDTVIDPHLIKKINIENHNLFTVVPDEQPVFDFIFLRNTIIYFNTENRREILSHVLSRLKPDGYLFLSSTEMPLISHTDLALEEEDGVYFFRKKSSMDKSPDDALVDYINITIQEQARREESDDNYEPESHAGETDSQFRPAPDPELIIEYAGNRVNNRIFFIANDPNYELSLKLIRIIHRINLSDSEEAQRLTGELEISAGSSKLTDYLYGYISYMKGDRQEALAYFKNSLGRDSGFWPAGFHIAVILSGTEGVDANPVIISCIDSIRKYIKDGSFRYQILLEGFNGKYFLRVCEQFRNRQRGTNGT